MQNKSLAQTVQYIYCLDFTKLIQKTMCTIQDGGYNWDLQTATIAENRYKKWLYLAAKYGAENLEIDGLQDLFWHQHILDTQNYHIDCNNIFGYFLHHNPFPEKAIEPKIYWKDIL